MLDSMKGSLVQRELSAKLTEGLYFFEFFPFYNPSASHLLGTSLYTREAWVERYSNNRFFMKLLTEEWVKLAFSCERRGTASAVDE